MRKCMSPNIHMQVWCLRSQTKYTILQCSLLCKLHISPHPLSLFPPFLLSPHALQSRRHLCRLPKFNEHHSFSWTNDFPWTHVPTQLPITWLVIMDSSIGTPILAQVPSLDVCHSNEISIPSCWDQLWSSRFKTTGDGRQSEATFLLFFKFWMSGFVLANLILDQTTLALPQSSRNYCSQHKTPLKALNWAATGRRAA